MLIDILTAMAVVVSVGLLFGILLALFIRFFGIEDDKKTKAIRAVLPGVNCGACGYTGCNDYAEAVANGTAKPNLCIPGAKDTAKEIGMILGVEVEEPKDVIAFVHCNGTCDAAPERVIYDGIATCKASSMIYGGPKVCSYGCLGCGDCARVCVSNAITVENGVAKVDSSRCLGCGMCAKECPKKIITMIPQDATAVVYCANHDRGADARKACKNACIGCMKCAKLCPSGALNVTENCAVIDYSKCNGCSACTENCPTGCIKTAFFPDLPEGFTYK